MKADDRSVQNLLSPQGQYIIPLFQRSYSWKREHWLRLLSDIDRLLVSTTPPQHFLGSVVCLGDPPFPGKLPSFQLIDGQQRMTTLTILLAALRDVARRRGRAEMAEEITESFLLHRHKRGNERYKILPRVGDRIALTAIVDGKPDDKAFASSRADDAWRFFMRHIEYRLDAHGDDMLGRLFQVITGRLSLVIITVDGEDPYEIFESLNTAGLPLSQADLIRNFVFMQVDMDQQEEFDNEQWRPMEEAVKAMGRKADEDVLSPFYRDYHIQKHGFIEKSALFLEFKRAYTSGKMAPQGLVADLAQFAPLYVWVQEPDKCPHEAIREQLKDLKLSDIGTANPLVMHLLNLWQIKRITEQEVCDCMKDLVSFSLRRSVCGEGTGAYGRWFAEAVPQVKGNVVESLRTFLANKGWPDDGFFIERLQSFPIYRRESLKTRLVLLGLERGFQHREPIKTDELTIEHVMPQTLSNNEGSKAWKAMLGEKWEEIHEEFLDQIGNLTLTGYNTPLGNKSYKDKQRFYTDSHVELNKHFATISEWKPEQIRARGRQLAERIASIWPKTVSGQYVPLVATDTMTSRDEKRERYWRGLVEAVNARDSGLVANSIERNGAYFAGKANEVFNLWAWSNFGHGSLRVGCSSGLGCSAVASRMIRHMAQSATQIEKQLGFEVAWQTPKGEPQISVFDAEAEPGDESDWDIEYAWASSRLVCINNVIMASFEDILTDKVRLQEVLGDLTDTQLWHLRYWRAFKSCLFKQSLPRRFAGVWLDKWFRRIDQVGDLRLGAGVKKDGVNVYLVTKNETLREALGKVLVSDAWKEQCALHGAEANSRLEPGGQAGISLFKQFDTSNEAAWPEQHEWLAGVAGGIHRNVFKGLESLAHESAMAVEDDEDVLEQPAS